MSDRRAGVKRVEPAAPVAGPPADSGPSLTLRARTSLRTGRFTPGDVARCSTTVSHMRCDEGQTSRLDRASASPSSPALTAPRCPAARASMPTPSPSPDQAAPPARGSHRRPARTGQPDHSGHGKSPWRSRTPDSATGCRQFMPSRTDVPLPGHGRATVAAAVTTGRSRIFGQVVFQTDERRFLPATTQATTCRGAPRAARGTAIQTCKPRSCTWRDSVRTPASPRSGEHPTMVAGRRDAPALIAARAAARLSRAPPAGRRPPTHPCRRPR